MSSHQSDQKKLREQNQELREAYQRLRESERLRNDLVHMVVHDLKVPLSTVTASLQTLKELGGEKFGREERHLLNLSISGADSLMQMICDLLDIAKLEEHKLTIKKEPSSLEGIINGTIEQLGVVAARRKIQISSDLSSPLPEIPADEDRIRRVLMNLLSNALRHTPKGGSISVTANISGSTNVAHISVRDTGAGIPRDALLRIFDKFAQVESQEIRKRSSSGLGLTFCKLVVEAHGGRIWAESEPDAGATIHFELPLA